MDSVLVGSISVATIGAIASVYIAKSTNNLLAKNKALDIELERQKLNTLQTAVKYDIVMNLLKFAQYQKIYNFVSDLIAKSNIDRVLIFVAINGKTDLKHVTCIFQKFRDDLTEVDAVSVYKDLEVDKEYVYLLKRMELENGITLEADKITPSLIKTIYETEKVKWSRWEFLGRLSVDEKSDIVAYCSCSTFKDIGIDSKDLLAIKLNMKGLVANEILKASKDAVSNKS